MNLSLRLNYSSICTPLRVVGVLSLVRTTPLSRALRHDHNLLDSGKPRTNIPEDTFKTETAGGRWLDKKRNWKIDWNNRTLTRHHDWRRYTPTREECPIPVEWLSGVGFTLER